MQSQNLNWHVSIVTSVRGLCAGRRRWSRSYEQRAVFTKVAQFNLCGRNCTAAIDSVMKPLSFKFCLLYIHKEKRARQSLWRHANTLISFIRAAPNWREVQTLTTRTNALRAQTCAGQEEEFNFLYPLFNASSHILRVRILLN